MDASTGPNVACARNRAASFRVAGLSLATGGGGGGGGGATPTTVSVSVAVAPAVPEPLLPEYGVALMT